MNRSRGLEFSKHDYLPCSTKDHAHFATKYSPPPYSPMNRLTEFQYNKKKRKKKLKALNSVTREREREVITHPSE